MLNNATNTQADALRAVVEAVEEALFVLRELYPRTLPTERRMIYSAAYGLIRIGSVIEQHRSQLEQTGPDYPWADWIDRRDNLVKRPDQVGVDEIARAVTEDAPQLVRDITGASHISGRKCGWKTCRWMTLPTSAGNGASRKCA